MGSHKKLCTKNEKYYNANGLVINVKKTQVMIKMAKDNKNNNKDNKKKVLQLIIISSKIMIV